ERGAPPDPRGGPCQRVEAREGGDVFRIPWNYGISRMSGVYTSSRQRLPARRPKSTVRISDDPVSRLISDLFKSLHYKQLLRLASRLLPHGGTTRHRGAHDETGF